MPYPGFKNQRDENRDKPRRALEIDTVGQTETFLTANVKLITFIVCMIVLPEGYTIPENVFEL